MEKGGLGVAEGVGVIVADGFGVIWVWLGVIVLVGGMEVFVIVGDKVAVGAILTNKRSPTNITGVGRRLFHPIISAMVTL